MKLADVKCVTAASSKKNSVSAESENCREKGLGVRCGRDSIRKTSGLL